MYLAKDDFRPNGEEPQKSTPHCKGYPARRDPQAENPKGLMPKHIGLAALRRMRQKYSKTTI